MENQSPLVSAKWLHDNLDNERLVVLDASMSKVVGKDPIEYSEFVCLPQSQKCDIETAFHNVHTAQPHSMPSAAQYAIEVKKLGITDNSIVVVYDNQGIYSSPRAWWMFNVMGHKHVYVLDGGLPNWIEAGYAIVDSYVESNVESYVNSDVESNNDRPSDSNDSSSMNKEDCSKLISAQQIMAQINDYDSYSQTDKHLVIDARAKNRFLGEAPEPRKGVRSGHIPHSINLPFSVLLDNTHYQSPAIIQSEFVNAGLDVNMPNKLVFSCGSGITACIVLLAANIIGFSNLALYDGSWSEWGSSTLPIE